MSEIYYLHTNYDIKKIVVYFNKIQGLNPKYNKYGEVIEGQTGKLIRKYIGLIGVDNIVVAMNNSLANKKDRYITNKALENEFKKISLEIK